LQTHDIAIVGAGVIGTSAARELQLRGLRCLLIDKGDPGRGTSFGNAGLIATEQMQPLTQTGAWRQIPGLLSGRGVASIVWRDIGSVLPWGWSYLRACGAPRVAAATRVFRSLQADTGANWRELAAQCAGVGALTQFQGHDEIFESEAAYRAAARSLRAQEKDGVRWRELSPAELAAIRKIAARAAAGVRFLDSGFVRSPVGIVEALHADFLRHGGAFIKDEVRSIEPGFSLRMSRGDRRVPKLLVAAGSRSAPLLQPLGLKVPLIAERGYHLSFHRHIPDLCRPLVLRERSVVVTPMEFGFRSTSFVEFGSPGRAPNPSKWRRLARHLAQSGISARGDAPDAWMGERPTLPDYLPAIGESGSMKGLFYALGHQHLGLTLSASTARLVADLIALGKRASFLDALDLRRFG
jgi:glycine/D-amino acid oxidase-like deaminating enzyme